MNSSKAIAKSNESMLTRHANLPTFSNLPCTKMPPSGRTYSEDNKHGSTTCKTLLIDILESCSLCVKCGHSISVLHYHEKMLFWSSYSSLIYYPRNCSNSTQKSPQMLREVMFLHTRPMETHYFLDHNNHELELSWLKNITQNMS